MHEQTLDDVLAERSMLPVPLTGQLVDLGDANEIASAVDGVRQAEQQLAEVRRFLTDVLRLHAAKLGTKTLHLDDCDVVISGGHKVEYDAQQLADELRQAGLPEERLEQVIVAVVTYKVSQRVLNQLAAANPTYKEAIERCRRVVPVPWQARVERGPR